MHGSRELKQTFYESRTIKRLNLLFAHVVLAHWLHNQGVEHFELLARSQLYRNGHLS